jgi:hypothetical protein
MRQPTIHQMREKKSSRKSQGIGNISVSALVFPYLGICCTYLVIFPHLGTYHAGRHLRVDEPAGQRAGVDRTVFLVLCVCYWLLPLVSSQIESFLGNSVNPFSFAFYSSFAANVNS